MTVNSLFGILKFVVDLDNQLRLQVFLDAVRDSLSNIVSQPAQPQFQASLASALDGFSGAAATLATAITPSQAATIAEIGGEDAFDATIASKVRASISANAMTPTVARDFVQILSTNRAAFLATAKATIANLEKLEIKPSPLTAGAADVAFLIPREIFDNELSKLAKELTFISRLLGYIGEGLTGAVESAKLENLSSSIPTIALIASLPVIATLGTIVTKFLEAWERIQKIRKTRADLEELGVSAKAVEELDERITTVIEEVVEESTEIVLTRYDSGESRKHELQNALNSDLQRLFGQIERGLTLEFRAELKGDAKPEDREALNRIVDLSRQMQFPAAAKTPLLLTDNTVIEGEISHKVTKKVIKSQTTKTSNKKNQDKDE